MTRPVSIVIPALDTLELLEANLPALLEELETRGLGDQAVVVDDSGRRALKAPLAERFPTVDVVTRKKNGGFAVALREGVERARHELVFSMNSDVLVRSGFLDPLVACLDDPEVIAVTPRVLLGGEEDAVESLTGLSVRGGLVEIDQPALHGGALRGALTLGPVAFAVGGTCLFRKEEFLATEGFDPLFEPFYWEDLDWCWQAWRQGRRVLYQPASVVEHHHRGTIRGITERTVVRAAIERNRLLFAWKHLDEPELLREHVAALYRSAIDAWLCDASEELVWLNLALEKAEEALESRRAIRGVKRTFTEVQEALREEQGPGQD